MILSEGKFLRGMQDRRVEDLRDLLRAEMAKNQIDLLAKLADIENRLGRRIEKLEAGK
jgi:hypothetical protein